MSVKVVYKDFEVTEKSDEKKELICRDVKELMCRDASWGTFVPELQAAKATCGAESYRKWKATEPKIENLEDQRYSDSKFCLNFPKENFNFESESVDHFVGVIAGDIVLNPSIKSIEVWDFEFLDDSIYQSFPGPNIGVDKLYDDFLVGTLKDVKRPILAFTLKPRFGMSVLDIVKLYKSAAKAGIDIVEDDERLVDPECCPFEKRIKAVSEVQRDVKTVYSANITGDSETALKKLEFCAENNIRMVKVDALVCGFETLRKVAKKIRDEHNSSMTITVYPDAYRAYRRLSRRFILKLSRLCGADIIYGGSPTWARYEKECGLPQETTEPVYQMHLELMKSIENAPQIKPTLATITNDQHPCWSEYLTAYFRKHKNGHYKYAFFVGGGISSFPEDIENAARIWVDCLKHAATHDLGNYKRFDFSKYTNGFKELGWEYLNIEGAL
jgi:ribulose 1,5-bisphosphate carboxylase large subunit-like protein